MSEQREVLLHLTKEQSEIIAEFINFNNWDADKIIVKNDWKTDSESDSQIETVVQVPDSQRPSSSGGGDGGGDGDHDPPSNEGIEANPGECEHCFCVPCITTYTQAWLGSGAQPHMRNSAIRKVKYRKFWKLMSSYNAWIHPRYLEKKRTMLQQNNPRDLGEMYTLREIMPECVLDVVRDLYPNPPGRPYMGHMWN
ncbi:hypothetical protein FSP39_016937 [Pinctada imbricata]|uniref:Uncharacterized protein n=1 Tax=Pinctada imbricata TaxID=66713 RepID=A0AA88YSR3_PINIB|nr:hypothetical protein FSP39_016937 [Pinctada imbricata]